MYKEISKESTLQACLNVPTLFIGIPYQKISTLASKNIQVAINSPTKWCHRPKRIMEKKKVVLAPNMLLIGQVDALH